MYWRYFYFLKKKIAVSPSASLKKQSFAVFSKCEKSGFWKCKCADFVEPNNLANHVLSRTRVKVLWIAYPNGLLFSPIYMGKRLRERWEFCFWERENEWNGRGKKEIGKNAHTPLKLSTTGQKTLLTFLLANLLLKLFTTIKLILQLVTR